MPEELETKPGKATLFVPEPQSLVRIEHSQKEITGLVADSWWAVLDGPAGEVQA